MRLAWITYSFKTLLISILVVVICGCRDDDPGEDDIFDGNAGEIEFVIN